MSVSKPSIRFWKRVISIKWRNKLLIHKINLAGHRKSVGCLQLLDFLDIWVIAPFWYWRSQAFPKDYCHHDLKVSKHFVKLEMIILETFEYYRKYEVKITRISFRFTIYPSCERALNNGRVKWKVVWKSSLNFTFGQGSWLISDFATPS